MKQVRRLGLVVASLGAALLASPIEAQSDGPTVQVVITAADGTVTTLPCASGTVLPSFDQLNRPGRMANVTISTWTTSVSAGQTLENYSCLTQ